MVSPHFGIVIQGPLDSRGFDSRPNILEYLAQAEALPAWRFSFCLSTWAGAELGSLAGEAERLQPLFNTPPPGRDYENRRRQLHSASMGARQLAAAQRAPDFLIKVRTDQRLSLELLCGHLLALQAAGELNETTVVAPGVSAGIPYFVADFYYGGVTAAVLGFVESVTERNEAPWQHAVEIDFAYKFLASRSGSEVKRLSGWRRRRQLYYGPWLARGELYRTAAAAWQLDARFFRFFPRAVYAGMLWRGRAEPGQLHLLQDLLFHEDYASIVNSPAEPGSYPRFDPLCALLLWGYAVELWVCALLRLRPRAAFERLAYRRRWWLMSGFGRGKAVKR